MEDQGTIKTFSLGIIWSTKSVFIEHKKKAKSPIKINVGNIIKIERDYKAKEINYVPHTLRTFQKSETFPDLL